MTINNSEAEILDAADEQAQDLNQGLGPAEQVEAAIRDFVRQDVTHVRRVPAPDQPAEVVASVNSLVQRVAGASLREMQNVIWELGACAISCRVRESACSGKSPTMRSSPRPR
jgi:hypothetical protein